MLSVSEYSLSTIRAPRVRSAVSCATRWLFGLNLVQRRLRNVAAYLGIMLVATALGANPVAAWLVVLTLRSVGRLTLFRVRPAERNSSAG